MRRYLGAAAAALAVAVLVGCSGPSSSDSGGADAGAGGSVAEPAAPGSPQDADPDRQVVTTATASLEVENPAEGAQRISVLVESAGGRVDERTEQAGSGKHHLEGAAADLVVRVPAAKLTDLLADLENLGDVANVSVARSDVTGTAVDLDARISALQTSVARLQALMDGAPTTEALLAAEDALSDRQEQLESLRSQRSLLADQVELSTLNVHLVPFGVAPAGGPDTFLDGLGTGWRALLATLGTAVVVLGVLLPWLVLGGSVAAAVLLTLHLARRPSAGDAPVPPTSAEG
jgi:hypothetical protein